MCRRVQGSQILKQNWIISICSRVIVILLIWVSSALWGVGQVGGWCQGWSTIVYMSSGMFRGKESLNRIELSQLVQELLNFGVSGSLWLWGMGGGWMLVGDGWGMPPTHVHMHGCTRTHAHACMVNMIISCKWPPPLDLGKSRLFPMMSYTRVHVCICMCVHMCRGHLLTIPHPYPPTSSLPGGDPSNQSKFNSTWTNQDISILFEDLKSVETSPLMGGCIVWWVGGLMGGSGQNTKKF